MATTTAHPALDAYGHLNWTVGNRDWLACFDAVRCDDDGRIHYHVVVDCESGGFTDTLEAGMVECSAQGIQALLGLPDYWADLCAEHYRDDMHPDLQVDGREVEATRKDWEDHLYSLLA